MKPAASLLLVLSSAAPAFAASHYGVLKANGPLYLGRVVGCEGTPDLAGRPSATAAQVARQGQRDAALANTPLTPGDRILTPAGTRCEAELDTGTVLHLDEGSALRFETILAPSLSTGRKLTNLVLEQGQVRLAFEPYDASEVFQVLTAGAAVKPGRRAVVRVALGEAGETRVGVEQGEADVLFGRSAQETRTRTLRSGDAIAVSTDGSASADALAREAEGAFARWGAARDQARRLPPAPERPLPATLRNLPPAVVRFAEGPALVHGQWVWTAAKEHAWRPGESDDPSWRPYTRGRFTTAMGQRFWVGEEVWGWTPYHLGFWYPDPRFGWVWVPGSTFAAAWITQAGCDDEYSYWPFGPHDWRRRGAPPLHCDDSWAWFELPYWDEPVWIHRPDEEERPPDLAKRRGDPTPPSPTRSPRPGRPRPERDLEPPRQLRALDAQLERLAARLPERWLDPAASAVPHRAERRPETTSGERPRSAPTGEDASVAAADAANDSAAPTASPAAAPILAFTGSPLSVRFLDWNPDLRAARGRGVAIRYDSVSNRVLCDGCAVVGGSAGSAVPSLGESGSNPSDGSGFSGGPASGGGVAASAGSGPQGGGAARGGPIDR